jgi:hypothetical protein
MAGQDIDAGGSYIVSQFDIMWMVANHKRTMQIQPIFSRCPLQEHGIGLDACTPILTPVRTAVDGCDADPSPTKLIHNKGIDRIGFVLCKQTFSHS